MKILILSFRAGEGHNSAAKAILERIQSEGHEGEIVDFLGLYSKKVSSFVNDTYVGMVKHMPWLFGTLYKISAVISDIFGPIHSLFYIASVIVSRRVMKYIEENGPYDGIVATHFMPSQALSHLKKHGRDIPVTIAVATDYTWYPSWQDSRHCDYHVIPHEDLIPRYVKHGIAKEKLCPYGIPTGMRFLNLLSRDEARADLGFNPDTKYYLMMGGSMGAGSMLNFAKKIYEKLDGAHMVIICGKNEGLRTSLEKLFGSKENVHIVGFTTEVPKYMVACDILYTKPGGLSSSEALICRIPTVHTTPIPGCESDNFRFFTSKGCSLGAKRIPKQIECGVKLMASDELRENMRKRQAECAKPDCSLNILKLIENYKK